VTDADVVLGYLPVEGFAGNRMTLDADAARRAIERDVGTPLGLDITEAAWGIRRIVDSNMANATRRVCAGHGADPRELAMISFGGNGAGHAVSIARELGMRQIVVPRTAPAFSALGVLVADYVVDLVKSYVTPLSQVDIARLRSLMTEVTGDVRKELEPTGLSTDDVTETLAVQMCYPGQNFDMSVPVPEGTAIDETGLLDLAARFHDQHETERGFCFRNQQPLVRGVRLEARGHTPKPERLAALGDTADATKARRTTRAAWFGDSWVDTPVYDGPQLAAGATIDGPALVDEPFTVLVLPPGASARLDDLGNYVVTP
jgi:N-methylhydantoinase A/oxoprolinase/acetone carboxylase beta subunit